MARGDKGFGADGMCAPGDGATCGVPCQTEPDGQDNWVGVAEMLSWFNTAVEGRILCICNLGPNSPEIRGVSEQGVLDALCGEFMAVSSVFWARFSLL